jgi:hypothetical protein
VRGKRALVRNAVGTLTVAASRPTTTGPPVSPRSMKMLVVAVALPRRLAGALANTKGEYRGG